MTKPQGNKVATHGEEAIEILIKDEVLYQAGDLMVPARLNSDETYSKVPHWAWTQAR